jgi:hypothetical protein
MEELITRYELELVALRLRIHYLEQAILLLRGLNTHEE